MFEVAAVACMLNSPLRCRDVVLTFEGDVPSLMQCALGAQPELAKWAGDHPNWLITKFKCQPAGQTARL